MSHLEDEQTFPPHRWVKPIKGAAFVAIYFWLIYETFVAIGWWGLPVIVLLLGFSVASAAACTTL